MTLNQNLFTGWLRYLGVLKDKFFAQNLLFLCLHPNNKLDGHLLRFHQLKNWKISTILNKTKVSGKLFLQISTIFSPGQFNRCQMSERVSALIQFHDFCFYFCCARSTCPPVRLSTSWNRACHFQHPLSETSLWEYPEIPAWPASCREKPHRTSSLRPTPKHLVCVVLCRRWLTLAPRRPRPEWETSCDRHHVQKIQTLNL